MKNCPLFFDLDGPLLDVRSRYHGVYASIARELGVQPLSLEEYWTAKRRRAPLGLFFPGLAAGPALQEAYLQRWLPRIESPEWLARDTLVPGAVDCLESLAETCSLYLVTLRREPDAVWNQLTTLGLRRQFSGVFSGWAEGTSGAELKASWIRSVGGAERSAIVGDSEVDMAAARLLGIPAIGVSFGIREAKELAALGAVHVVDRLSALPGVLVGLHRGDCRQPVGLQRA
jgi:phosphoglycolate phosphatase